MSRNRHALERDLRDSSFRRFLSPASLSLYRVLVPRLRAHAAGRMLDAGCGVMPFRRYVLGGVARYDGLDQRRHVPEIRFLSDVEHMTDVPSEDYDALLCSQVLEHVAHPSAAITEFRRVLRDGGKLIVTVPHLSRLHEEPHDFFRFTEHGIRKLLEDQGFRVIEIVPAGSVFSLLGHQVSSVLVGASWHIPVLRTIMLWLNTLLVSLPAEGLDRLLRIERKLPLNYVVVAER